MYICLHLTFLQLCVVAAFTHFPTSYQRAKVIKFSNEGSAAITQNCPLGVCACHLRFSVRFRYYFQNLPIFPNKFRVIFWSECVSPKPDMAQPFLAVWFAGGVCAVDFSRGNTTCKRGKATLATFQYFLYQYGKVARSNISKSFVSFIILFHKRRNIFHECVHNLLYSSPICVSLGK